MMRLSTRIGAFAAAAFLASGTLSGARALPPAEAFAQLPDLSEPKLSPDGRYYAAIQSLKGRPAVTIYDTTAAAGTLPAVIPSSDWLIDNIAWAKADRLIIVVKKNQRVAGDDRIRTWQRALAVDPRGDNVALFFKSRPSLGFNTYSADVTDVDLDDPDNVFIPLFEEGADDFVFDLFQVDSRTGQSHVVQSGSANTAQWIMDGHGHVVARVDETQRPLKDHLKLYKDGDWKEVSVFDATADNGAGIVGITEDGKNLVQFGTDSKSNKVLGRFDLGSEKDDGILFSHPVYDVSAALLDEWTGRVIGATYIADKAEFKYFDPALQALQDGLEKSFPNLTVATVSLDVAKDRAIVATEGPRSPPVYYFLDRKTHLAEKIAVSYPNLTESDLGEMKPYPYSARDGLAIHAYLTMPPNGRVKGLPVVVMPHGGPDSRDAVDFDWWAQFLANRGYAVLQPNFRGSSGYGHKFTEAGLHQWGLKMQDDITDGVQKLIADGIADPKRVCIVGASYGGYAALAGAAFTPDLYACAVSFAGISDLPKMLQTERSDSGSDSGEVSFWTSRIGSLYDDSDELRAVSPARHADRVKCPVLLMHGEGDTTVRINQSEAMYEALKSAGKDVQFIRFPGEDHYLNLADTRLRVLTEIEKFLAAHIGT